MLNKFKQFWAWTGRHSFVRIPLVLIVIVTSPLWASAIFIAGLFVGLIIEIINFFVELYKDLNRAFWPPK